MATERSRANDNIVSRINKIDSRLRREEYDRQGSVETEVPDTSVPRGSVRTEHLGYIDEIIAENNLVLRAGEDGTVQILGDLVVNGDVAGIRGAQTYSQPDEPTGLGPEDEGALWADTDDQNHLYRWSGAAWVSMRDQLVVEHEQEIIDIGDAVDGVGGRVDTIEQDTVPFVQKTLEEWETVVAQAAAELAAAMGIDPTQIVLLVQPTEPATEHRLPTTVWFDTTNQEIAVRTWNGTSWVASADPDVLALRPAVMNAWRGIVGALSAAGAAQDAADAVSNHVEELETLVITPLKDQWEAFHDLENTSITDLVTGSSDAFKAAQAAQAEALIAAGLAADKGRIWPQDTVPPAGLTHEWEGADHTSPSIQRLEGAVHRINEMINPRLLGTDWSPSGWSISGGAESVFTFEDGVLDITLGLELTSNFLTPSVVPATGGVVSAAYMVENLSAAALQFRIAHWNGAVYTYGEWFTIKPGETARVVAENLAVPAGSTYMQPRLHTQAPQGAHIRVWEPIAELVPTVGTYFDGYSPDDRANDLWINTTPVTTEQGTAPGNVPHRWDSTTHNWIAVESKAALDAAALAASAAQTAEDAASDASTALASANGKNRVIYSQIDATGTTDPDDPGYSFIEGDTWFKIGVIAPPAGQPPINGGNPVVRGQWRFNGTGWDRVPMSHETLASIDFGVGIFGFLKGRYLEAGTVAASVLMALDTTNLIADSLQSTGLVSPHTAGMNGTLVSTSGSADSALNPGQYAYFPTRSVGSPGTHLPIMEFAGSQTGNPSQIPVIGGQSYRIGVWIKFAGNYPNGVGTVRWAVRQRRADGTQIDFTAPATIDNLSWVYQERAFDFLTAADCATLEITLQASAEGAGFRIAYPSMRKSGQGTLITPEGILTENIGVEQIVARHLVSDIGSSIDISSNQSINIVAGQVGTVADRVGTVETQASTIQDTVDAQAGEISGLNTDLGALDETVTGEGGVKEVADKAAADVEQAAMYYSFTPTGLTIGIPGEVDATGNATKPNSIHITNDRITIIKDGVAVSWWEGHVMHVEQFEGTVVNLGKHQFQADEDGTGTVIRAM